MAHGMCATRRVAGFDRLATVGVSYVAGTSRSRGVGCSLVA